ncbi:MAG: hydrogenase maturation nickel metallochaperone HypA [Gammaproteobacteria bacterium]|nr:hydrogenase maturation nickel metallochaperone HypA [Gammaproteobacteria bacterium]MBT7308674.1 hydrogenase maturation nickel metallochaperone HypA [Gammaproteobacteria bacterium]
MHELSVCQSILSQVETVAEENSATTVSLIHLQIGPLSGVEVPLLKNAWTIARADTLASEAELEIEEMPITIRCSQCGQVSRAKVNRMICGQCGEWRTQLISGDEMLLRSIELEK